MDPQLIKRLALQCVVGGVIGWYGAELTEKLGIPEPQGFLLILAGFVAWGYYQVKTAQQKEEAQIEDYIDEEVERRCKEKQST